MLKELIDLLTEIKGRIQDDSDLLWTGFETADELRSHIDNYILRVGRGDIDVLDEINTDFLPTSTFQELALQNGWSDDYMRISTQFDEIYKKCKSSHA